MSEKLTAIERAMTDRSLSNLAARIMALICLKYLHEKGGGRAFPKISTLSNDLGGKSDSNIRAALGELVTAGHLVAERRPGAPTVYKLPDSTLANPAHMQAAYCENPAHIQATHPAHIQATHPAHIQADKKDDSEKRQLNTPPALEAGSGWERFSRAWTFGLGENEQAARSAFLRLSRSEREAAIQGAAAFQGAMAGRLHPPHAATYLREKKWKLHRRPSGEASRSAAAPKAAIPGERGVFLRPESEQLAAWHAFERATLGRARTGCHRPTEWPPSRAESARA